MSSRTLFGLVLVAALAGGAPLAGAQSSITLPPSGDNQRSTVSQGIGLVTVSVDYSSPDVHGPGGEDRTGKIWGELVPYGLHDLGFRDCTSCPWRAGANHNTVFTASNDVLIEGQPLKAGAYGLHMIAGPEQWTVIFSRNSTSWGSYSYDPAEDALRVTVEPAPSEYHEWLTYEFTDRQPDHATVALKWEKLQVPIQIKVDGITDLYLAQIRKELRDSPGFSWVNWDAAAQYCLQKKANLAEGMRWADMAVNAPFSGDANFTTLTTLGQLQLANGKKTEASASIDRAMTMSGITPIQVHMFARGLQQQGDPEQAMRVFTANAKRFPNQWPVNLGLARGYDGKGEPKKALPYAKQALAQAPDEPTKKSVENFIGQLERKIKGS